MRASWGTTRRAFLRGAVSAAGLLLLPLSRVRAAGLPGWVQGAPVNGWVQIANTALQRVDPSPIPPGNTGPISKVVAWCGFALDTRDSTLYSVANGGHHDYAGNEVDALVLSVDAPAWVQRLAPTPTGQIVAAASYYADSRPTARHTYHSEVAINNRNRVMICGVGARYGDGFSANNTDGYDFVNNAYDPAGTYPNVPFVNGDGDLTAVKVTPTEDIFFLSDVQLQKWTNATNSWASVKSLPIAGYYACAAYDSSRGRILFIDQNGVPCLYVPSSNTFSSPSFTGPNAGAANNGGQNGLVYVPALDVYFLQRGDAGGTVYRINASTLSIDTFPTTGGGSIPSKSAVANNGIYTRWQYCPQLGGIVYVPDYSTGVWFLRTNGVGSVGSVPSAPPGVQLR